MRTLAGLFVATLLLLNSSQLFAQNVTSIEDDWQLQIDTPNALKSSPQLNCVTSTGTGGESQHAIFLTNEGGSAGGNLRLQLWDGDQLLKTMDVPSSSA